MYKYSDNISYQMQLVQIIRIAVTNLSSNRMRSLLTVVGISIGIASIVFLVSLGYGLQELSVKKIASIEAINTLDVSPGKNSVQKVDDELIAKMKEMPEIDKISPVLALGVKIQYQDKKTDAVGNFVDDNFVSLEGLNVLVGGFFQNSTTDIVVSTAFLKAVSIDQGDAVGKEIPTTVLVLNEATKEKKELSKNYKIIGTVLDDSTSFIYAPIESVAGDIAGNKTYNSLKVKVKDKETIPDVRGKITSMGFTVTSIADTISQVDQIFKVIQGVLAFFGLIALLVASIGMFNTMTIALLERTRDIGIMKALGVRNRDVSRIFLSESMLIAGSGGILGVLFGLGTAKAINYAINILAKSVGGEPQKLFSMPMIFAAGIIIFSMFVGIATGFYPSRRASRLNPLDALRYE